MRGTAASPTSAFPEGERQDGSLHGELLSSMDIDMMIIGPLELRVQCLLPEQGNGWQASVAAEIDPHSPLFTLPDPVDLCPRAESAGCKGGSQATWCFPAPVCSKGDLVH